MDTQLKTACLFLVAGGLGLSLTLLCTALGLTSYMGALYQLTLAGAAICLGIGGAVYKDYRTEVKRRKDNRNALKG